MRSRWLGFVLATSIPSFVCGIGCIPHPADDFNDYNARTEPYRQTADASSDSAPPEGSVKGLYFGACLSKLAAGRVDRVLRFYTEVDFVKDATGPTGKISLKLTSMKLAPGNAPPPTVSKSETVGKTYSIDNQPTNELGVYSGPLGSDTDGNGIPDVQIPGEANPISGREIVLENVNVPGRFAPGTFCSQLIGHVVQPTDVELEGPANTCIFIPVNVGDPTPPLKIDASDFKAGCALQ
jgi:hypothetical protein